MRQPQKKSRGMTPAAVEGDGRARVGAWHTPWQRLEAPPSDEPIECDHRRAQREPEARHASRLHRVTTKVAIARRFGARPLGRNLRTSKVVPTIPRRKKRRKCVAVSCHTVHADSGHMHVHSVHGDREMLRVASMLVYALWGLGISSDPIHLKLGCDLSGGTQVARVRIKFGASGRAVRE